MSAPSSTTTKKIDKLANAMEEMDRVLTPQLKTMEDSSNSVVEAATSLSEKCRVSGKMRAVVSATQSQTIVKKADTTAPYARQA